MRFLVFGGTSFLSKTTASIASSRGHAVTCVARGRSGTPPAGVRLMELDREVPAALDAMAGDHYDVVVDVGSKPVWTRRALAALHDRSSHWIFVSSGAVYADQSTPGQRAATAPVRAPSQPDAGDDADSTYGARKAACEIQIQAACRRATIVRPGLIVGPEDPTDRFGYWPLRLALGGEVLVPGRSEDAVQWLDVRDLAAWLVRLAEDGGTGTYDAVGPAVPRREFVARVAAASGGRARFTWVDQEFLLANGVQPWMGRRSLPLWVPVPAFAGVLDRDAEPARAAGLTTRDLGDTVHDMLIPGLARSGPYRLKAGLTLAEERDLLDRYRG
jgi:2'-hydroxyisoflavone reductase